MDELQLEDAIDRLVLEGRHQKAEEMLVPVYEEAKRTGDVQSLDSALRLLVFVEGSAVHPNMEKLEKFCIERERNKPTAYNRLQTAMVLFTIGNDYAKSTQKLKEVIEDGTTEGDYSTVYSALGLLGRALLALDRKPEATDVLHQVEKMVAAKMRIVVGDETAFLEAAYQKDVEVSTVRRIARIASILAPACRDQEFRNRLTALAGSAPGSKNPGLQIKAC